MREQLAQRDELIVQLLHRVQALEERLSKDSHNSSLLPSSDRFSHQKKNRSPLQLNELRKRVLNLSVGVREEIKKLYIAYKLTTNFMDVGPQKNALLLYLNIPFEEIDDSKKMCEDVTHVGHRENGHIRVRLASMQQLEDVMYLVQQAFERQNRDEAVA